MKYLILFLISYGLTGCTNRECVATDVVLAVGGCSDNGLCGVMTLNHGPQRVYYPAPGQEICLEYK